MFTQGGRFLGQNSARKVLESFFLEEKHWKGYMTDAHDGTISGGNSKLPKHDKANGDKNRAGEGETKSLLFVHISKILQGAFINWINAFVKLPSQFQDMDKWIFNK